MVVKVTDIAVLIAAEGSCVCNPIVISLIFCCIKLFAKFVIIKEKKKIPGIFGVFLLIFKCLKIGGKLCFHLQICFNLSSTVKH